MKASKASFMRSISKTRSRTFAPATNAIFGVLPLLTFSPADWPELTLRPKAGQAKKAASLAPST